MTIQLVEGIIFLVSLVIGSNIINHYLPSLPTSLIQIGLGIVLAFFLKVEIPLQTDWFLLLFVAPLLFNDARTFPKRELWELRTPIVANAILLVFLTTFIGGSLIHWLAPSIPLSASFALAAILSPTDPVSVNSITEQAELPGWIMHLVAGESLINDASGLIGFKYGLAATVTGAFSLLEATGDFFYISIVGAIIGATLIYLIRYVRRLLITKGFDDITILTVMQFITPFIIYLVAEELHASGVIAVVVAGILTALNKNHYLENDPEYVLLTNRTWDLIVYLLDGIIFLILGIELPFAMQQVIKNPDVNIATAIGLVFVVWLFLFGIRVAWIYGINLFQDYTKHLGKISLRDAILSGLTGVRGAITMAGVLSLPMLIDNGELFPARSLILFIASGVIVVSLLMAVIFIPLITNNALVFRLVEDDKPELDYKDESYIRYLDERAAKNYLYTVAVQAVESRHREDENHLAALDVIEEYQELLRHLLDQKVFTKSDQAKTLFEDEITLRRVALRGESSKLEELKYNGFLSPKTYQDLNDQLRLSFEVLTNLQMGKDVNWLIRTKFKLRHLYHQGIRWYRSIVNVGNRDDVSENWAEKEMAKNAISFISDYVKDQHQSGHDINRRIVYHIVITYRRKIANLKSDTYQRNALYDQQVYQLRLVAFSAQRTAIGDLIDHDRITPELANKLRQEVNFAENTLQLTNKEDELRQKIATNH